jgi:hypothetical protein
MFEQETVLVLGAGASCHYGYPTGDGLIDDIRATIFSDSFDDRYEGEFTPFEITECKELHELLSFFDPLSIDTFLSQHSYNKILVEAGKHLIAHQILVSENPEKLERRDRQQERGNWYRFLLNDLFAPPPGQNLEFVINKLADKTADIPVKIITFNYDISLEFYLHSRLGKSGFLKDNIPIILERLNKNIIHVYGKIGGDGRVVDNYGSFGDYGSKAQLKKNNAWRKADEWKDTIHVIGDERDQIQEAAQKAKGWLSNAKNIFFLGYGFDKRNNALLDLENTTLNAHKIYYTNSEGSRNIDAVCKNLFRHVYYSTSARSNRESGNIVGTHQKIYPALLKEFSLT